MMMNRRRGTSFHLNVSHIKMRKFFKLVSAAIALALIISLSACGASSGQGSNAPESNAPESSTSPSNAPVGESGIPAPEDGADNTITVGVNPVPHAEILENAVRDVLAEAGWELEVMVFQDYVLPNTSLEAGELDANYFQTLGYMNGQNEDSGLHLAAVAGVHIEPMGIYSQKYQSLDELPDGAEIGIPNDPENTERGLNLLLQKGLLSSLGGYGTESSVTAESLTNDSKANPHGYKITTLEAASLPLALPDLDAATINGNYALEAELPSNYPALEIEEFDEETTVRRTNFIVVRQGDEESAKTQALVAAINSDTVKQYIESIYKGSVIPSFIDPQ